MFKVSIFSNTNLLRIFCWKWSHFIEVLDLDSVLFRVWRNFVQWLSLRFSLFIAFQSKEAFYNSFALVTKGHSLYCWMAPTMVGKFVRHWGLQGLYAVWTFCWMNYYLFTSLLLLNREYSILSCVKYVPHIKADNPKK